MNLQVALNMAVKKYGYDKYNIDNVNKLGKNRHNVWQYFDYIVLGEPFDEVEVDD